VNLLKISGRILIMRKLFGILFLSLLMLGFSGIKQASGVTIFNDNFDAYQQQLFPFPGGWELFQIRDGSGRILNGAGNAEQYVDTLNCVSNTRSLHLSGSSCWSACAYHAVAIPPARGVTLPAKVTLTANVRIGQNVACGCGPALAKLAMFNPEGENGWGTGFGGVSFNCDGFIYGGVDGDINSDDNVGFRLIPFMPNTWYNIRIDLEMDLRVRVSRVIINGTLILFDIPIRADVIGTPTGVVLCGGYAINNPDWYDDVCVLDMLPLTLPPAPRPAGAATLSSEGLLNIPNLNFSTIAGTIDLWTDMQLVTQCSPPDICFKTTTYGVN
jgi:hypothetical protein